MSDTEYGLTFNQIREFLDRQLVRATSAITERRSGTWDAYNIAWGRLSFATEIKDDFEEFVKECR